MIQLPPNATGQVLASLNSAGREYQQVILCDKDTPSQQAAIDTDGSISVKVSNKPITYSATSANRNPGTSATTCIADLQGSVTKKVKLKRLVVSFNEATAAAQYDFSLVKTSDIASGGVAAAENSLVHETTDPAATAIANFYTTTPAAGTPIGTLFSCKLFGSLATAQTQVLDIQFQDKQPTLADNTESFDIRIGAATPAHAGSWNITWVWAEE
jgi:hypothetical protein